MQLRSIASIFLAAGVLAAGAAACSSSSSPAVIPCNQNPWECTAGQTCWPQDLAGNFQCLNSGAGKKGDVCSNTVGSPSCADGLACLQLGGAAGFCAPFCDPTNAAHACASGESCATITLQGTTASFKACVPTVTPTDAGGDADETGADSGADAAADAAEASTDADVDASETGADAADAADASSSG